MLNQNEIVITFPATGSLTHWSVSHEQFILNINSLLNVRRRTI